MNDFTPDTPDSATPGLPPLCRVEDEPYTLASISAIAGLPYHRVRYCYATLARRASTRDKVQPLDGKRPFHFSAAAANFMLRHCLGCQPKK